MDRGNALEGTRQTKSSSHVIGEVIQGWKGEEDEYVDIDSSDDDNNSGDNKKGTTNQSSRDLIGTAYLFLLSISQRGPEFRNGGNLRVISFEGFTHAFNCNMVDKGALYHHLDACKLVVNFLLLQTHAGKNPNCHCKAGAIADI
jgi:hypothetical protein